MRVLRFCRAEIGEIKHFVTISAIPCTERLPEYNKNLKCDPTDGKKEVHKNPNAKSVSRERPFSTDQIRMHKKWPETIDLRCSLEVQKLHPTVNIYPFVVPPPLAAPFIFIDSYPWRTKQLQVQRAVPDLGRRYGPQHPCPLRQQSKHAECARLDKGLRRPRGRQNECYGT